MTLWLGRDRSSSSINGLIARLTRSGCLWRRGKRNALIIWWCPSRPDNGFSGKPTDDGWGLEKIATAWDTADDRGWVMTVICAQGGDWVGCERRLIGAQSGQLRRVHVNLVVVGHHPKRLWPIPRRKSRRRWLHFVGISDTGVPGYCEITAHRPQTLFGYGLADSPVGQMA